MEEIQQNNKTRQIVFVVISVLTVLILDQWLKFHIKTTFSLGQSKMIFSNWFELHFTENPGMAFGLELGGKWGKIVLTIFRIIASVIIMYYIKSLIKERSKTALVVLVSLILAGA
ncbi:MAG: signal peptidase II, partial [Arenicella sp.]